MRKITLLLVLFVLATALAFASDVSFVSWNILNYPGSSGPVREPYYRTVLASIGPDILVVQEMLGQDGVDSFLENVLLEVEPGLWSAGPFHNSYDSDRAIFYRNSSVEILDYGWLDTALRDIEWWQVRLIESGEELRVFTLHLKASQGSDNEEKRFLECTVLRDYLDTLPADLPYIVAGDLNIYQAGESAYELLMSTGPGQLFDPIDESGNWHDNSAYAPIHTQSTRTVSGYGGGATGGLDDRFDQILVSEDLLGGAELEVLPETYTAYGNDGEHFNQSIIAGGNSAVPYEVAEALHNASDHLPVIVDLSQPWLSTIEFDRPLVTNLSWPSPVTGTATVRFELQEPADLVFSLFDSSGRWIATVESGLRGSGPGQFGCDVTGIPTGTYLAQVRGNGRVVSTGRILVLR